MKGRPGVTHFWYITSTIKRLVDLRSKEQVIREAITVEATSVGKEVRGGGGGIGRKAFYFLPFEPEKVNHDGNRQTYL